MAKLVNTILCLLLLFAVGCNSYDASDTVVTRSVVLYANEADNTSRTSFGYDGEKYKTSWVADDQMQVLICTDEAADYTFTLEDVETGRFVCPEVADITTAVDAYGVYPSSATISSSDYTAAVQVGAAEQTQVGNSPNHVAALDPLYGKQQQVAIDDIRLQMCHTASVMQFSIKNEMGADVTVSSVTISAPKPIAGEHTLDLQSGELVATENVSNTIKLTVTDVVLSDENTLTAWIAMSPFEMTAGEELVFVVTTSDGRKCKFVKKFGGDVAFPSGKVMEMAAPIVLSESTLMAANISISVDLTQSASYPDTFPTSKTTYDSMRGYRLGGYPFGIYCTQPYAYSNSALRLYFNGGNTSKPVAPEIKDYALIYFPYYEGYKLVQVGLSLDANNTYKFRVSIANPDNLDGVLSSKNPTSAPAYQVDDMIQMGADVSKQCCLYLHFKGVDGITASSKTNCGIKKITLNYVLE